MKITTTYPELPDDVKSAICEINALINATAACIDPKTKEDIIGEPDMLALTNIRRISEITQKLMSDQHELDD